ncbi:hypothetical protein CL633_03160 [bacterium]|nr:hypothetical protein [bacterium]|tara:strand:- start:2144 stop:3073 length:930 start_codon:yes stop_codon:yes gene_type:complete
MNIIQKLNPFKQCKELNLGIWQCPSFLFLLIGLITITAMISTYFIAKLYTELEIVSLIIALVAIIIIIFTIGHFIVQSVEQIAQANQMKTEFISIASHQLRTPLASIKWSLNSLMNKQDNNYLQNIYQANEQMIKLVNDLLKASRIEQSKLLTEIKPFNINKLSQNIANEFQTLIQANNIKLELNLDKNLDIIRADKDMIKIVMQNLVSNAVQYIKKSGKIIISTKQKNKNIIWQIQDNGIGIPTNQQKYIFKKFFRVESSLKFKTRGTGLGLYISQAIIKEHKGKIWFKSKSDKGTTFYFSIPLTKKI